MAKELRPLDAREVPGLLSIVEEVRESGEARVVTHADEEMAILSPIRPRAKRPSRHRKAAIITKDDSLWNIVGMADKPDDRVSDVSANKHKYLAEAYADLHK